MWNNLVKVQQIPDRKPRLENKHIYWEPSTACIAVNVELNHWQVIVNKDKQSGLYKLGKIATEFYKYRASNRMFCAYL